MWHCFGSQDIAQAAFLMVRNPVPWLLLFASAVANAAGYDPLWQLGTDDDATAPFSQESFGANVAPGSATTKDDDYYFAGNYPSPIGTRATDEAIENFERSVTSGDPRKRLHFPLIASQAAASSRLRATIDLIGGGAWINGSLPGFQSHDVTVKFNGQTIGVRNAILYDTKLVFTFSAASVNAVAGENILQVERTGGSSGGYIQFDYLKLEADPDGLADDDGDGLPRWFEETYALSDANLNDAALHSDDDGLTNLQEFQRGTNPTDPDSDNDGLNDAQETTTDPLNPDSDGDGLSDGAETTSNPALADSDADGSPDNIELEQGTNPLSAASKPFDFPGAIGLQFLSETRLAAALKAGEPAGWLRLPGWNVSAPLPDWPPSSAALTGSFSELKNHRGQATTAAASWSFRAATDGAHQGGSDEKLLTGMIYTSSTVPATFTITGIPFGGYDLVVYLGDSYPGREGSVQLGSDTATKRYFTSASGAPFVGWNEATATSQATANAANFIRFRNLSGSSQSVTVEQLGGSHVAIHGFQILDSVTDSDGDGLKDIVEIEHGLNPAVADATADADGDGLPNTSEISSGTDPHERDTDHDGLPDDQEAAANANPLVPDTDGDGLIDGNEVFATIFPSFAHLTDSDSDGFSDPVERNAGSDPKNAASVPPPVPSWNAASRTWSWQVNPFRVRWNHDQAMLGALEDNEAMLTEAVVGVAGTGWDGQIGTGLRYLNGRLTWRFRCGAEAFHRTSSTSSGFWNSDWNDFPADRSALVGFSGYGPADDSDPLALEFTATRSASQNLWTLVFTLKNVANPNAPVTLVTWTQTDGVAASAALDNGTATWMDDEETPNVMRFHCEPGVDVFVTSVAVGTVDTDHDGMPDDWESAHAFSPTNAADATQDADGDGVNNRDEWLAGTDPREADSDGDGANDGTERLQGTDPLSSASFPVGFFFTGTIGDLDNDGLSDGWLLWSGGRARNAAADDDHDGMSNAQESAAGTDPDDARSKLDLIASPSGNDLQLSWTDLPYKTHTIETSTELGGWAAATGLTTPTASGGVRHSSVTNYRTLGDPKRFYRTKVSPLDTDGDGVEDWTEVNVLESSTTSANSLGQSVVRANGQSLSGDALTLYQKMTGSAPNGGTPGSETSGSPSPAQASRFLMQATFGPVPEDIDAVRQSGYEAWIDAQLQLPPSYLRPYIRQIKADAAGPRADRTYNFNELDEFVHGNNVTTPFARNAVGAPDQLRQRVAFALSQILVTSRRDAQLEEKAEAMAHYYDTLVRHALGNYRDLLTDVSFHPVMGWYLSHVGNQKADPSIPRYPDENYAREVMQLFAIGLWELNPDGSRKLDAQGEPIPTYDNGDITEMARVFTGLYFDAPYGWEGGGWDEEDYTKPMVMYPEHHDFGRKVLLNGVILPEHEESAANGVQDVRDAIDAIFQHPNTPVFVGKQLIQFLVTDNPSPDYIRRVQDVFVNDGNGVRGNLAAVIKAILLDPEARQAPLSPSFGKMREPVVRTMHLGRLFRLAQTHPDFVWWNWQDNYYAYSSQEPMNSPSVFNFYTPVYQSPGEIRNGGFVSPGLQIVNSYTAVALPNLLLDYLHTGFRSSWSLSYPLDYRGSLLVADTPEALVDRVNLLVCAGNMTARTRSILLAQLANPNLTAHDRTALAVWLAMVCPEGAIQN
jgi:uncharacterized protein (DUF1800 family)